jgi:hypothetical protein
MDVHERVERHKCPLCRGQASSDFDSALVSHGVANFAIATKCQRCGEFSITWEALTESDRLDASVAISGIAREWTDLGRPLEINKDNLGSLISLAPRTFKEKKSRLIQAIIRRHPVLNQKCYINASTDYYLGYVGSIAEYAFLRDSLLSDGLISSPQMETGRETFLLLAKGWELADAIEKPAALREKVFVAMWFNDLVTAAFKEGIAPAIGESGYRAIRIDLQEHSESVIDRIIAEIKEARFVVADFTGHRSGVYFEAGFARGLGLDVIWMCKEDHLKDLHFDVRGFNVIVWKTPAELRERLHARIRAVVGYGPLHDPR